MFAVVAFQVSSLEQPWVVSGWAERAALPVNMRTGVLLSAVNSKEQQTRGGAWLLFLLEPLDPHLHLNLFF